MAAHYGMALIPDAYKNALNAVIALIQGENPAQSENLSQPANAAGHQNDAFTHWYGGRLYSDDELPLFQNLASNLPSVSWSVIGTAGVISLTDAQAACVAMVLTITTRDAYTSNQAQQALAAALGSQGLKKINWDE